ncbi:MULTISPECIES: AMP-binding protein [unclassified Pseudonocardia]|uniref:AMP-binding protein n=1 Tax=unclassified Pseudonocardia TaxID=2619320 RepID=UPI0001FFEEA0|nr:AMP-binding protein [Pseudonocardia sp. Ae707_Ps1]OLM09242.1 Acetyl-coenzyme A synthetase [Pseudonocardia sp. Ae707_Ps1]
MSEFELPAVSVPALVASRAAKYGDRAFVSFEGEVCSYAQLLERSDGVAAWLQARGIGPGDRVAMLMSNSLEFLYVFLGIARAGAVSVPVNASSVGEGLHYTLEHSGAAGIVADAALVPNLDSIGALPDLRWRTVTEEVGEMLTAGTPQRVELGSLDPMSIIYTSGTTGPPKGVVLSHTSYLNTGRYFVKHYGLDDSDVLHTCLPLFHCNAQQCTVMPALIAGARVALNGKFSLSRFWDWIDSSGATVTNLLGSMLALMSKRPQDEVERRNRLKFMAAAPVPEGLHRPLEERFGLQIVDGYGLTETGTMACKNPVSDTRSGTIGIALDHNEVRIVDPEGNECAPGVTGEIVTRSRIPGAYMTGYFREPEKTAEAMRDGWFHTGDAGYRREDGYHVFVDRMKDTIRRRGENISSFLVEKAITAHPDIVDTAAIAVPSDLSEDDVKVLVVRRPGASLEPADVIEWAHGRLAEHEVPRYVEFRDEFPRTATGRIQKYTLRGEGAGAAWDREAEGVQQ